MFTPEQCRAARGLLGWSQQQLADHARVGLVTVHQLEAGISQPRRATVEVIQRAFEDAGIEFTNGEQPGVRFSKAASSRLRPRTPKKFSGIAKSRTKRL
jgi:transcriptional regulator with XRE-family HTH domain